MKTDATSYPLRLVYSQDIQDFKRCSISTAYANLRLIKKALGKQQHQVVTNKEAAAYYGVGVDDFERILKQAN